MRRQTPEGGAASARPSRVPRLDPLALPVRFAAPDAAADGRIRYVEIDHDRVLISRSVRGMAIRVRLPVHAYKGITARAVPAPAGAAIVLTLDHRDRALSIDLFAATDDAEAIAHWRLWGDVLGLPLLAADQSGVARPAGALCPGMSAPRRRRCNAIRRRRPTLPLRRKPGVLCVDAKIHRGREIIARD